MISRFNVFINESNKNKNSYDYILGDTIISNGINNDILYKIIEKKKHKFQMELIMIFYIK